MQKKRKLTRKIIKTSAKSLIAYDPLTLQVLKKFIEIDIGSRSIAMRKFSIGFERAERIVEKLEKCKFISPADGTKPRKVLITMEEYIKMFM